MYNILVRIQTQNSRNSRGYRLFSPEVHEAILVCRNKEMAAILVSQNNLWEMNSVFMQIFPFAWVSQYGHWSREWKRSFQTTRSFRRCTFQVPPRRTLVKGNLTVSPWRLNVNDFNLEHRVSSFETWISWIKFFETPVFLKKLKERFWGEIKTDKGQNNSKLTGVSFVCPNFEF